MHLLVKNYRGGGANKCKRFWTTFCNSHHLDLRFSYRQVQTLLSFGCGSATSTLQKNLLPPKQLVLTTQHHIQEMTCSVHKPNHCGPSEHHYPICTEWLPRHLHYKGTFLCTIGKSTRPVVTKKWGRLGLFGVCVVHSSTFGRFHEHFERTCYNLQD